MNESAPTPPNDSPEVIDAWEIPEILASLVDKSLVIAVDESRYGLLETVRNYSLSRLASDPDSTSVRTRHLSYFEGIASEAAAKLQSEHQSDWLERTELEHRNLRAALDFATSQEGLERNRWRIAGNLGRFWIMRGYVNEGRQRVQDALQRYEAVEPSSELAMCLHWAGNLAFVQTQYAEARRWFEAAAQMRHAIGDFVNEAGTRCNIATIDQNQGKWEAAREQFERSLAIFEQAGAKKGMVVALGCLGSVAHQLGDEQASREYLERTIALNREMGDRSAEANSLNNLGPTLRALGDEAAARQAFERSLEINRELGNVWEQPLALVNLASCSRTEGDFAGALCHLAEAIEMIRQVGDRKQLMSWLNEAGLLAHSMGRHEIAVQLLAAATVCQEETGVFPTSVDRDTYSEALRSSEKTLGENLYQPLYERGRQDDPYSIVDLFIRGA